MSFKGQNVVITGGHGFIGTNLRKALIRQGANVLCVSRSSRPSLDLEAKSLYALLHKLAVSPNYIVHLASIVGGIHYLQQHQATTLRQNLIMLSNSFKDVEKYPDLKGQVFMSSVCAYPQELQTSDSDVAVLSEEQANIHNPDSTYGWSKIMGELFIRHYFAEAGVPGVSLRLFNTYGPHEHFNTVDAHVIPALMAQAHAFPKKPFEVLGDGKQVRAFLYVDDAVDAVIKALKGPQIGGIINIGATTPCTIKELVDLIIEMSQKDIVPVFKPLDSVGAKGRLPDITKAAKLLNWAPTCSLREGLDRTYKWLKSELVR